jgi:anti-sigma regulatory factor (Ser/Thr protein kinase)
VIEAAQLPPPLTPARELLFGGAGLAELRRFVGGWGAEERLHGERAEELVLAVNELATNSILYGGGQGKLRVWREADTLLCEVQDGGHMQDPLVGRERPTPDAKSGRGLWLVNHLCDLVQIRSSDTGTVVRVHKHLL